MCLEEFDDKAEDILLVDEKGGAILEDVLGTPSSKTTGYFDFNSIVVFEFDRSWLLPSPVVRFSLGSIELSLSCIRTGGNNGAIVTEWLTNVPSVSR